jgi:hypothetical protein
MRAYRIAADVGGTLWIAYTQPEVREMLEMAGVLELLSANGTSPS